MRLHPGSTVLRYYHHQRNTCSSDEDMPPAYAPSPRVCHRESAYLQHAAICPLQKHKFQPWGSSAAAWILPSPYQSECKACPRTCRWYRRVLLWADRPPPLPNNIRQLPSENHKPLAWYYLLYFPRACPLLQNPSRPPQTSKDQSPPWDERSLIRHSKPPLPHIFRGRAKDNWSPCGIQTASCSHPADSRRLQP